MKEVPLREKMTKYQYIFTHFQSKIGKCYCGKTVTELQGTEVLLMLTLCAEEVSRSDGAHFEHANTPSSEISQ